MAKSEEKKIHTKVGDRVIVTSGRDKGKVGNVKEVDTKKGEVLVEGVNMVTKAQKANPMAGIQATRVKHEIKDGKKIRVCKKCSESLDV